MKENKKFILNEGGKSLDDLLYTGKGNSVTETVIENPGKALLAGAAAVGLAAVAISKATKKGNEK
jgi:hypothetical protein